MGGGRGESHTSPGMLKLTALSTAHRKRKHEAVAAAAPMAAPAPARNKAREFSASRPSPQQKELNIRLCRSAPREIEALVREQVGVMNSVNCATALHGLAKATSAADPSADAAHHMLAERTAVVLKQEGKVTARSLTSIMWAVGKLRIVSPALIAVTTAHASTHLSRGTLDTFGMANVAWSLANLHQHATSVADETVTVAEDHAELLDALAQRASEMPSAFNTQELCNLLWSFATIKRRHAALFESFAEVTAARAAEFTPQGLSQTIWAYSKLNLSKHSLLLAIAAAAMPRVASFDAQSLATLAWSFANLEVEHRPLLAAICAQAKARASEFGAASCSQLLWALSRLSDGVDALAVRSLARQLQLVAVDGLKPQQLLYALGALAKLPVGLEPQLPKMLCLAAAAAAPHLTANKLGIACWALSRPSVLGAVPAAARSAWHDALRQRATHVMSHLGWRGAGYVEVALRQLGGFAEGQPLVQALTDAVSTSIDTANSRAARRCSACTGSHQPI